MLIQQQDKNQLFTFFLKTIQFNKQISYYIEITQFTKIDKRQQTDRHMDIRQQKQTDIWTPDKTQTDI